MDHDLQNGRLAAWTAFLRAYSAVTSALERALQEQCDLPLTWFELLLHLRGQPYGLRMQELAHSALLSKSGLTRAVDRMEAAGLVERRACPNDRRGIYVVLTGAGEALLERAIPVHGRAVRESFTEHLTEAELETLAGGLDRVAVAGGTGPAACERALTVPAG
jgi:DNA-binding MarR family transcriptional regulator